LLIIIIYYYYTNYYLLSFKKDMVNIEKNLMVVQKQKKQ